MFILIITPEISTPRSILSDLDALFNHPMDERFLLWGGEIVAAELEAFAAKIQHRLVCGDWLSQP